MKKLMLIFAVAMATALSASAQTTIEFNHEYGDILSVFMMEQTAGSSAGEHLAVARIVPVKNTNIDGFKTATVYYRNGQQFDLRFSGSINIVPAGTAFIVHMDEKTYQFLKAEGDLPPTVYTDGYQVMKIILSK